VPALPGRVSPPPSPQRGNNVKRLNDSLDAITLKVPANSVCRPRAGASPTSSLLFSSSSCHSIENCFSSRMRGPTSGFFLISSSEVSPQCRAVLSIPASPLSAPPHPLNSVPGPPRAARYLFRFGWATKDRPVNSLSDPFRLRRFPQLY